MPRGLERKKFAKGIKIVIKYLKPYKGTILLLAVFGLIGASADALVPLISGRLFDSIIAISKNVAAPLTTALTLVLIWLIIRLISDLFGWRIDSWRNKISTRVHAEYTARGIAYLLQLPMAFHKHRKHGEVTEKINRASNSLDDLINNIVISLAPQFLSIIIALAIAFTINFQLSLILITALIVYIFILWLSLPQLASLQLRMNRAYSKAYGQGYDILNNVQEVKQATTEKFEERRMLTLFVTRAASAWFDVSRIWQKLRGWQRVLITLTQLSIFVFSLYLVKIGQITPGELVAFNGYAAMFFGPFVTLGNNWGTIQNGLISIIKAEEILTLPTEKYQPENAIMLPDIKGKVEFDRVSFGYEKKQKVLNDISFVAKTGEVIALVGKSGIGKTTTADLIQGLYMPASGKIFIDGHDLKTLDLIAYRRQIATVPQEVTLFNDTVLANITYGTPGKSEKEAGEAAKLAHAADFIDSFPKKYKQIVGWRGIKLSTGQKQRIAIARAILRNPKILILDEPTSALDAESEKYIKESLRELMKSRTTFIVAHRLSTIKEANKILVIEKGKITESGRHEELIKKPGGSYRKLYELQVGFY